MRTLIIAVIMIALLSTAAGAGESGSSIVVVNNAPYPIVAEVIQGIGGPYPRVPVPPGGDARIDLAPGDYLLRVRPAIPLYFVGLPASPNVLILNPYVVVPVGLGPGEVYEYEYTVGDVAGAGAGVVVLRSALSVSALVIDGHEVVRVGYSPSDERGHYIAAFVVGEGDHTFLAILNEEEPIMCIMGYELVLSVEAGEEIVADIPQNLSMYVAPISIVNELAEAVTVEIAASAPTTIVRSGTHGLVAYTYLPTRRVTVAPNTGTVVEVCAGTYTVRVWAGDSPGDVAFETQLNITTPAQPVAVTIPDMLGGALTIRLGECVQSLTITGSVGGETGMDVIGVGGEWATTSTVILPPGEYRVVAELGDCGMINAPRRYEVEVTVEQGGNEVIEIPPPPAVLAIANGAGYELVVSVVNSTGGLVSAITLQPFSGTALKLWPGNYTVVANPLTRPGNYVGPISGMRWEGSASLGPGDRASLIAEPTADSTLEIVGPPGAEVLIDWGTSSAKYTIPPNGSLRLLAAPVNYTISSCPSDVLHSCWYAVTSPSGDARVVIVYGLRTDVVWGVVVAAAGSALTTYLIVRRRRFRRTHPGVTGAPP